jgi:hypothetical protein
MAGMKPRLPKFWPDSGEINDSIIGLSMLAWTIGIAYFGGTFVADVIDALEWPRLTIFIILPVAMILGLVCGFIAGVVLNCILSGLFGSGWPWNNFHPTH